MLLCLVNVAASRLSLHEHGISEPTNCVRNKTLHLIRHAEGWHNVDELEAEAAFAAGSATWRGLDLQDPRNIALRHEFGIAWTLLERVSGRKYHDPLLTPKGREQAYALRTVLRSEPNFGVDAVAFSPMRRTIATALLSLPSLEVAVTTFPLEASSEKVPRLVASDLLRERVGPFMCDSRLPKSALEREYARLGATIEFGMVTEADEMFEEGTERNEPEQGSPILAARAATALRWISELPEARIAVVAHRHILFALTSLYPQSVAQQPFSNAERRTMILCDQLPADGLAEQAEGGGDESSKGDGSPVRPMRARVKPLGQQQHAHSEDSAAP